jgi:hypothetical protein
MTGTETLKVGAECECPALCPECRKYLDEQSELILESIKKIADGNPMHLSYLAEKLCQELVLLN